MLRLWQEVWQGAFIELCLSDDTALEEILPRRVEGSVEKGEECHCISAQNLLIRLSNRSRDVHALDDCFDGSHSGYFETENYKDLNREIGSSKKGSMGSGGMSAPICDDERWEWDGMIIPLFLKDHSSRGGVSHREPSVTLEQGHSGQMELALRERN
jgi:hypothetical protein